MPKQKRAKAGPEARLALLLLLHNRLHHLHIELKLIVGALLGDSRFFCAAGGKAKPESRPAEEARSAQRRAR
jgi:hypothetical protein